MNYKFPYNRLQELRLKRGLRAIYFMAILIVALLLSIVFNTKNAYAADVDLTEKGSPRSVTGHGSTASGAYAFPRGTNSGYLVTNSAVAIGGGSYVIDFYTKVYQLPSGGDNLPLLSFYSTGYPHGPDAGIFLNATRGVVFNQDGFCLNHDVYTNTPWTLADIWHHIVVAHDDTNGITKIWDNGDLLSSHATDTTCPGQGANNDIIAFGYRGSAPASAFSSCYYNGSSPTCFDGALDNVALYALGFDLIVDPNKSSYGDREHIWFMDGAVGSANKKSDGGFEVGGATITPVNTGTGAIAYFSNGGYSHNWNPDTGTGTLFQSDLRNVQVNQTVNLNWVFYDSSVAEVRLYDGASGLYVSQTSSAATARGANHYGTVSYGQPGEYQPYIWVCNADGCPTHQAYYLGGEHTPNPLYSIKVTASTAFQWQAGSGSLYQQLTGTSTTTMQWQAGSGSLYQQLTGSGSVGSLANGIFGLQVFSNFCGFGTSGNFFIDTGQLLLCPVVLATEWVVKLFDFFIEHTAFFGLLHSMIHPTPGCYTIPNAMLNHDVTDIGIGGKAFCVEYATYQGSRNVSYFIHLAFGIGVLMWISRKLLLLK